MPYPSKLQAVLDDLAFLDDWDERYRYLIELGRAMAKLPPDAYSETNRVQGCASQVWLTIQLNADDTLEIKGDSDAMIVKGLVALVLAIFSGQSREAIRAMDAHALFKEMGLSAHLTAQRSNGLASMVARIKSAAA